MFVILNSHRGKKYKFQNNDDDNNSNNNNDNNDNDDNNNNRSIYNECLQPLNTWTYTTISNSKLFVSLKMQKIDL